MDEKKMEPQESVGVDLNRALKVLWKKAALILILSLAGAVAAFLISKLFVTPQYEATAMFYVNNSADNRENTSQSISSADISAGKSLVEPYLVILNTNATLQEIIDYAGVDYDCETLREKITAKSVNSTAIFSVTVESSDPARAQKVAQAVAHVLPERIAGIIEGSSAITVDDPVLPEKPSSPNSTQNAMIGFILVFILAVGTIILREIFDVTIRSDEDISRTCSYPILTQVPDMTGPDQKKGYGRGLKQSTSNRTKQGMIGGRMNFVAAEAYKLLRTKLQFSFAGENECRVIGVSSALSGEGKSLTASNLAYTLSLLNKQVLLVDCDMRKPTLAEKLGIEKAPGLSNFLTGQNSLESVIQREIVRLSDANIHAISAGPNPPNPVELLSSTRMAAMLTYSRTKYDYIILDLPPVCEVSDAMAVAGKVDGMLLIARQNKCNRQVLTGAIQQLEFVDAKILGVVFNGVSESSRKGYYYGYYRREKKEAK